MSATPISYHWIPCAWYVFLERKKIGYYEYNKFIRNKLSCH